MRLQLFDVFAKTAEDAKVRTSSGGVITLGAFALLGWLLLLQIRLYTRVAWDHQLVIDDSGTGEKMVLDIDVVLPHMPCELLNIDAVDDMGDVQQKLQFNMVDLDSNGQPLDPSVKQRQQQRRDTTIHARPDDFEGSCYGAEDGFRRANGLGPDEKAVCRTCDDIRKAYVALNWAFHDGHGFSQCVEEGYPEAMRENSHHGCRVSGQVLISKVVGRLHIAPGESHFRGDKHSHDLSTYEIDDLPYDFTHEIRHFGFRGTSESGKSDGADKLTQHAASELQEDALAGYHAKTAIKNFQFRYFLKVVGTDYTFRNGTKISTNQYSVTHHERPLNGGRDADHPHSVHKQGGIPGIWFNYDISPMRVREIETRAQSFGELLMNIFAIVGAVITSAAVVDKGVYAMDQALKARKDR